MRYLLILFFIILASCASIDSSQQEVASKPAVEPTEQADLAPRHQRVYYFEHKLLPNWLHHSEGSFFYDLTNGNTERLIQEASIVVDEEFAQALNITFRPEHDAVVFEFDKPRMMPNCYFAVAVYTDDGYIYTTYEKTLQFDDEDKVGGVVGGWTEDGSHLNMGGRTYSTVNAFIADVLATPEVTPTATTMQYSF